MGLEKGKFGARTPGEPIFKSNLSFKQRISFFFLVPTALHCAVYISDIATDIALVERHYAEERCIHACLTLALIYAPAIVFLTLTLKDKKRWPKEGEDGGYDRVVWGAKQFLLAVFFPIHAMHRFAGKLFWGLEAIFGPREQLADSLAQAMKPSYAELYLLLQPFVQSTPQALLQTYIAFSYKVPQERTGTVQILAIITSVISAAIAAACYMQFESQRTAGKPTPWDFDAQPVIITLEQKASLMTTIDSHVSSEHEDNIPEAEGSPKPPPLPKGVPHSAILSLPPLPPNIRAKLIKASGDEIPEDLQNELLEEQRALNIRSSLYEASIGGKADAEMESLDFTITLPAISPTGSLPPSPLPPLPPSPPSGCSPIHEAPLPPLPISPPPSPDLEDEESYEGSVHEAPTNEATGTTTPETNLADHASRERLIDQSLGSLNEKPPTPPPRIQDSPHPIKDIQCAALTEDEFVRKSIAFIWWLLFIFSRVLALSTLAFFYPVAFCLVSGLHYVGMTSYLFSLSETDKTSTTILRLSLGFVFFFCILEIRDTFKVHRNFATGFGMICLLENSVSSTVWYLVGSWTSWWFLYTYYFINMGIMISFLPMGLYNELFHQIKK